MCIITFASSSDKFTVLIPSAKRTPVNIAYSNNQFASTIIANKMGYFHKKWCKPTNMSNYILIINPYPYCYNTAQQVNLIEYYPSQLTHFYKSICGHVH